MLTANIQLNKLIHRELRNADIEACAHAWGTAVPSSISTPDMLVMSDVVYDPICYGPLVSSIDQLLGAHTFCVMAHRHRHPEDHKFFGMLQTANLQRTPLLYELPVSLANSCRDVRLFHISRAQPS